MSAAGAAHGAFGMSPANQGCSWAKASCCGKRVYFSGRMDRFGHMAARDGSGRLVVQNIGFCTNPAKKA